MMFGPDDTHACPHRKAPVRAFTLRSSSILVESHWADGYVHPIPST
jgi:hypothetical protein